MPVDPHILMAYGAAVTRYKKGSMVFRQDEKAKYYFQVLEGEIRTFTVRQNEKEFVQGIFGEGESFGESPLFVDAPYPFHAQATRDAVILRLPKDRYRMILEEVPGIQMKVIESFARRICDQATAIRMLNTTSPELRLMEFLDTHKKKSAKSNGKKLVEFTRQEIANMTGMRVETVIRTFARLKEKGIVEIIDHKVYY